MLETVSLSIMEAVRLHRTIGVRVGHLQIGGGAPVAVQSMTMTDTADADGNGAPVHRARRSGVRARASHRQRARGGRCGPRDQAADARRRLPRAADRRLPLQRPPAPDPLPGVRGGARQVPDQSRQRRDGRAARRTLRHDLQGRHRPGQAGPDRRERRIAEPGSRRLQDAGEHRPGTRAVVGGHPQRVHGRFPPSSPPSSRSRPASGRIRSSSRARSRVPATSCRSIATWPGRPNSRCTSG